MKSRLFIFLYIMVCSIILLNTSAERVNKVFQWDKSGYHLYLPAALIYHDIQRFDFYPYIDSLYQPAGAFKNYELHELLNGNRINKYPVGVAVHELPFFVCAHFINQTVLHYPADGYSIPYQWGAIISTLFYVVIGLFLLRKLLLFHFSDTVITITLLLIASGTNLYHYTVFSPGMAHTYAFFHFAGIMLFTHLLYSTGSKKYLYLLAFMLGLTTITRSMNLLAVLIPLLWGVYSKETLFERVSFLKKNIIPVFISVIIFIITLLPQLLYWKYVTGTWFYDAYSNEGFIWAEPRIIDGLLGFRKGWFIYTPLALFALYGIYSMRNRFKEYIPAIVIFTAINIYIVFSWWNWWYGGGFGCRPLIECMAVLAFPLGAFVSRMQNYATPIKSIVLILLPALIPLNMFQSYQQWKGVIHWDKMSKAYYFRVFLKTEASEEDKKYLMSEEEFLKEYNHRLSQVKK